MKQVYTLAILLSTTATIHAQTWTKVSGIMDSSQVKGIGVIANQILLAGQNWASNTVTDYAVSNDGGNTWSKLPTYQFAGYLPNALPQNGLMLCSNGFTFTKQLVGSAWSQFAGANNFAEFSNGSIIGSAGSSPDTLYNFSSAGIKGAKLGNYTFKLSPKYCAANNDRLFLFAYGVGLGYIDYNNLGTINIPATLDGVAMTQTLWDMKLITDVKKAYDGTLYAIGDGVFKSTDNGLNWTRCLYLSGDAVISITISSIGEIFVIGANKVRKSTDNGITWTNVSGNLPPTSAFKKELFVNSNNDLFCLINKNGAINPNNSGIYKLTGVNAIDNINISGAINIYPNPNNSIFNITTNNIGYSLTIVDLTGKQVYNTTLTSVTQQINAELNAGIYFVKVGNTKTQKLIIN